jgi:cytochrome c oxidase subunit 2
MNFPFLPERASTFSDQIDALGLLLTVLTIFFTALVFSLMLFFAVRYRRGSKVDRSNPQHHNLAMELTWSVIPLVLGLGVFFLAMIPYTQIYNPPANAEEIFVIGKRWMWHLEHTNGIRENNELHVPTGRPFKLTMTSQDVIHGFYVPAFRMKRDAMPGRYNTVWFEATRTGRYHLFCTEYCGTNHSEMGGWVYVMTPSDYATWLKTGSQGANSKNIQTAAEQGRTLFSTLACSNCHGNQDTVRAPSLAGIYNRPRKLLSGQIVNADDEYLRGAIRKPEDHLLEGYGQVTSMPAYKEDQLTEEQVHYLIVYIKSLGGLVSTPVAAKIAPRTTAAAALPQLAGETTSPSDTMASHGAYFSKGTDPINGTTPTSIPGQPVSAVALKSGAQTTSPLSAPSRNTGSTP